MEPEVVGESDSEVEGDPWRMEREDSSEEEEEEIDEEVWLRKVESPEDSKLSISASWGAVLLL